MPGYAALLRGINVGGKNRVAMADLRLLLEGLGYSRVVTHLQSGNAVFASREARAEDVAGRIEAAVEERLGVAVRCLVRTAGEIQAVLTGNPLEDIATDGSRMLALFLSEAPDPDLLAAHDPTALAPGRVAVGNRVVYQWCPDGVLAAPPVGAFVERHLRVAATARNWNTVTRLAALLGDLR